MVHRRGTRAYPNVEVGTTPTLSLATAISTAKETFNEDLVEVRGNAELIILPVGTEDIRFHLTWKVGLFSSRPLRYVSYYVDAHGGDIVGTFNNVHEFHAHEFHVHEDSSSTDKDEEKHPPTLRKTPPLPATLRGQITGDYFPVNHHDAMLTAPFATRNIELYDELGNPSGMIFHTDSSGNFAVEGLAPGGHVLVVWLESEWVKLYNDQDPIFLRAAVYTGAQNTIRWNGGISTIVADASNVRYHAHFAHDFFKAFNFNGTDYLMTAHLNRGVYFSASAAGGNLYFGSLYGNQYAKASDVIYHEYTHSVINISYGVDRFSDSQGSAIREGVADYFAASITDDQYIGESVGLDRDLDNDTYQWTPSNGIHWNGQVIGGAIWDIRQETGPTTADQLAFTALQITPHAHTFADFGYNMVMADREHNGGGNESIIRGAFTGHGITIIETPGNGDAGGSVAIDTVEIVGPDSLRNWQNGTWEARVEGGNPPYVYQWEYKPLCGWRREASCGTWAFGGSEPSYSRMANSSFDFELKLTATDNARPRNQQRKLHQQECLQDRLHNR